MKLSLLNNAIYSACINNHAYF